MNAHGTVGIRLLLVGVPGTELRTAAAMACDAGANVVLADSAGDALVLMREAGADLVMIELGADVCTFIRSLRREHIMVPVFACGIDAPAVLAVAAIRAGALDYLPLPPDRKLIAAAIVSVAGSDRILVGTDSGFERAVRLGLRFASLQVPILISGEKGSGKQLVARAIHQASGRTGPFVIVDCADIGVNDIESELFGHGEGSFEGAVARRRGRIREAEGGTLFIRQVGTLPMAMQSRLSPLLGASASRPVALAGGPRIIASTSIDLGPGAVTGAFRPNLLAALTLVHVRLPSLYQRRADIALLAQHFARRFAALDGLPLPWISASSLALLERRRWPDNVRELEDVMHRAVLLSGGGAIEPSAMMFADGSTLADCISPKADTIEPLRSLVGSTVEDVERALILETLRHCRGNRTTASSILGISVRTMRNKLKTFIEGGVSIEARA